MCQSPWLFGTVANSTTSALAATFFVLFLESRNLRVQKCFDAIPFRSLFQDKRQERRTGVERARKALAAARATTPEDICYE